MIRIVINGFEVFINVNHIESARKQTGDNILVTLSSGGQCIISPENEGYDTFLKFLDGLTIHILSPLDPLSAGKISPIRQ